jgi:ABC-type Fe3+/spermidine/putrescine transport system ATPase subunit
MTGPDPSTTTIESETAVAETPSVALRDVTKRFDTFTAVDNLSLELGQGEFFTFLGPSGCGKTTTLRMIAGFEQPTEGEVLIEGTNVAGTPAHKRPTNTVFQSYALFPHMSVEKNVAFGLKRKGVDKDEIVDRVTKELQRVGLAREANRRPSQLSGGMQQRVALARALVNLPKVLLLDEPLGALDLKLRKGLQIELKQIQREVGITFVYVTHDQEEALTMSDRIAVFNHGRIEQLGTPTEVYDQPASEFVAGFVGTSNILERDGRRLCIRPERIRFAEEGQPATIDDVVFVGAYTRYLVATGGGERLSVVQQAGPTPLERGAAVHLAWRNEDAFELTAGQPIGGTA